MADKPIKIRCSICGDSVRVENGRVNEHCYKYAGSKIVCYGSFLPVLQNRGIYQVGDIMYISDRRRSPDFDGGMDLEFA